MNNFEILLLSVILFFPLVDLINEKYKSHNKNVEYLKLSFFLWIPTLLLIYLFANNKLSIVTLAIEIKYSWQNMVVVSLLGLGITYLLLLIKSIKSSEELREEIISKFDSYTGILPVTKKEMLTFTLIVSVSAGICEELLFRAYLFPLLDGYIGMAAAIIVSSIIFGLWHLYLGWQEVIRTSIMGAMFCGIYIMTGNIILPILVHIFIDVYSGLMCYFAMRKPLVVAN
jgi:uncharacterized protein